MYRRRARLIRVDEELHLGTNPALEASKLVTHADLAMDAGLLEEAQAIRRCQAGDKEAFRYVVERYGNLMYGTAYQITRNHARAQELTQDALVLAWRGINSFQGGSLKAWLVKILTNRGISLSRRRELDAATLDDPGWLKPAVHIWMASSPPWAETSGDVPKFDRSPG